MRQFVSNNHTNSTVVHGNGLSDVEEWSLEDSGWEGDGVPGWRVPRVDDCWSGAPSVSLGWFVETVQVFGEFSFVPLEHVVEAFVGGDGVVGVGRALGK